MSKEYPPDWDSRRKRVYERDNYKCQNCGRSGENNQDINLHAHHIVPKSKGGTHKKSNLISICEACHDAIHNSKMAPTKHTGSGFSIFKELVPRLMDFLEYAQGGVSVDSPGKIQNDKLEQERISLIQDFGHFAIEYTAPDEQRKQAMDDMIQSWIKLLRFPEDVYEKTLTDELSKKEAKEFSAEITEKRSEESSKAMQRVISIGLESFF
jgi:predicted restriction endonuclease